MKGVVQVVTVVAGLRSARLTSYINSPPYCSPVRTESADPTSPYVLIPYPYSATTTAITADKSVASIDMICPRQYGPHLALVVSYGRSYIDPRRHSSKSKTMY